MICALPLFSGLGRKSAFVINNGHVGWVEGVILDTIVNFVFEFGFALDVDNVPHGEHTAFQGRLVRFPGQLLFAGWVFFPFVHWRNKPSELK